MDQVCVCIITVPRRVWLCMVKLYGSANIPVAGPLEAHGIFRGPPVLFKTLSRYNSTQRYDQSANIKFNVGQVEPHQRAE